MPSKLVKKILRYNESFAYILALWSFLVLFLEPIVAHYTNYPVVENLTALANILVLGLAIIYRTMSKEGKQHAKLVYVDLVMLVLGALILFYQAKFAIFFLLIRQTYFIINYFLFHAFEGRLYKRLTKNPPATLMLSFLALISLGTLLLMLPASSVSGYVTPFVDALFTATSATCVTGLVVVDTGTYFSVFGQLVILLLIQLGGLGIMTVSTAFALILGQRLNLKLENVMHNVMGGSPSVNLFELLKNIVLVTLIIEIVGAIFLYPSFLRSFDPLRAMYHSMFHSVSAFCNAGFALYSDSLVGFSESLPVNLSITALIILGGIGFSVIIDLFRYFTSRKGRRYLSLHTRIVLVTSAALLALGMVAYFVGEYSASMKGYSLPHRLLASWFQSVTTRTAGFNTVDTAAYGPATILVAIIFMFIGASPGSTGGGIKTTTFAVLVLSVISLLTGRKSLVIFNRRIALTNFREATSLITMAVMLVVAVIFLLLLIEPFDFEQIIFEAVSAFGTVGLSMGITPQLSVAGKILVSLLMYIGRIGPLTIMFALSFAKHQSRVEYAEEKIAIG